MGVSLKDIFQKDEERLLENKRKTAIKSMIIICIVAFVLILLSIGIKYWGDIDEQRRIALTRDMQNIKTAVVARNEMHISDPSVEYPGAALDEEGAKLQINGVVEEYRYGYYLLQSGDLAEIAVSLNLPDEVYVVNYETGDVVNGTGVKYNGRRYHSLVDLLAIEAGETPISDRTVVISTAQDLNKIRNAPNGYFKLSADIDMSEYSTGEGWEPISNFTGVLDGRGYTISNLKINRSTKSYVGLFGQVAGTATITNLKLENPSVVGGQYTGSLAGYCSGAVSHIHVTSGEISGRNTTGGLIGAYDIEKITNCTVKANVNGDKEVGGAIGALFGGTVERISSDGNVTAIDGGGGLIGLARVSETTYIHEVAAHNAINGKNNLGGLIGEIEMTSSKTIEIVDSYAKGSIQTGETNIGGVVGYIYTAQDPKIVLKNIYADVSVVIKGETSGGFVGYSAVGGSTGQTVENCYWVKEINPGEVLESIGKSSSGTSMTFDPKSSAQMMIIREFPSSWDFEKTWNIEDRVDTPTLKWEANYVVVEEKKK